MSQLILHLWGDYILQSHWMACRKTESLAVALLHATVYSLPFLLIGSLYACSVILLTHVVIDRWRLARFVVIAKNRILCSGRKPELNSSTGYPNEVPPWLAFWLLILCDNTLHLTINFLALSYL